MNNFILTFFLAAIVNQATMASETISIAPQDLDSQCDGNFLIATIKPLGRFTQSRTNLVKNNTGEAGLCFAAQEYLQLKTSIEMSFSSSI